MRERERFLVVFAVVGLTVLSGCNGQLSPQAEELLRSGYQAHERGDDAEVVRRMDEFLAVHGKCARADEALYLRGLAKYRLKDLSGAKADLDRSVARSSNEELLAKAFTALGDLAYEQDDMALAENMYRHALEHVRDGRKPSGHARYRLGCVLQRQGRWRDADGQFDKVVHFFPETPLARSAGRRTHCTEWTVQTGAFERKPLADAEAQRLRAGGLAVSVRPVLLTNRLVFLVQVGRYPTYEQAVADLPKVRRDGKATDAFVTVTR